MSNFMFLYPVEEYINSTIEYNITNRNENKIEETIDTFNQIIDQRYRKECFDIYWLTFKNGKGKPNYDIIDDRIDIIDTDNIIDNEITFQQLKEGNYPEPDKIIDKLGDVDQLVLGGFHQRDCVERIAKHAYNKEIETFVDEDTTDRYSAKSKYADIPIVREEYSLESLFSDILADSYIQNIKEERKDKPWLVQE